MYSWPETEYSHYCEIGNTSRSNCTLNCTQYYCSYVMHHVFGKYKVHTWREADLDLLKHLIIVRTQGCTQPRSLVHMSETYQPTNLKHQNPTGSNQDDVQADRWPCIHHSHLGRRNTKALAFKPRYPYRGKTIIQKYVPRNSACGYVSYSFQKSIGMIWYKKERLIWK